MTIDQLRQLKTLSEMPAHSTEDLEALKELVRMATIRSLILDDIPDFNGHHALCDNCANSRNCKQRFCADLTHCEVEQNFQLRMEDA